MKQEDDTPAQLPSGRHGLPREYVVNSQRSRLLAAAVRTAGEDGYAGMTVSAVIARAGVSRKTFYELFQDREDIFLAAFDGIVADAMAHARERFEDGGSWPERVRALLAAGLEVLAARPHEARLCFVEALAAGPRALERRDAALRELMAFAEPGYDAAAESGDAAIPALMPEAVVGAVYEVIYARVLGGRTEELPALLPELLFCVLAPFVGPARAAAEAAATPPAARGRAATRRRSA